MTIHCPFHSEPATRSRRVALAVCHHCGRPLCSLVLFDSLFFLPADLPVLLCGFSIRDSWFLLHNRHDSMMERANHCERCLVQYHRTYRFLLWRLKRRYLQ